MSTLHQRVIALLCVIVICLAASCKRITKASTGIPAITMKENGRRAALGLQVVGTNWFLYSSEFGEENWKIDPKGYLAKKIHRDSQNTIQWEEDHYYSGKSFRANPDDPTEWEMLTLHYEYATGILDLRYVGQDVSIITLVTKSAAAPTLSDKLKIADEILKKWGMSR